MMTPCVLNFVNNLSTQWLINGALVLLISVLVTGILIPRILLISYRKNLFDMPDERKIHKGTVPRLGGMAFMPAVVLSIASVLGLNLILQGSSSITPDMFIFGKSTVEICFGLCALMMLYLVGLADDLVGVKYRAKFVVQIFAALLLISSGLSVNSLGGFWGIYELPGWIDVVLTIMVVVLVINAINLIDGIDGLASGLSAIALAFYAWVCFAEGSYIFFAIALAAVGTLIPFFYYNVFGNQNVGKKIFMGDTGALTSGLILVFIALKISNNESPEIFSQCQPLVLAFAPLVLPCLDVLRVFFHRIRRGRSPFEPGRTHIHHKFLALGVKQRYAMLIIILISAAIIALDLLLSPFMSIFFILTADIVLWTVFNILLSRAIRKRQKLHPEEKPLFD